MARTIRFSVREAAELLGHVRKAAACDVEQQTHGVQAVATEAHGLRDVGRIASRFSASTSGLSSTRGAPRSLIDLREAPDAPTTRAGSGLQPISKWRARNARRGGAAHATSQRARGFREPVQVIFTEALLIGLGDLLDSAASAERSALWMVSTEALANGLHSCRPSGASRALPAHAPLFASLKMRALSVRPRVHLRPQLLHVLSIFASFSS